MRVPHFFSNTVYSVLLGATVCYIFWMASCWIVASQVVQKSLGGGGKGEPEVLYVDSDSYYWARYASDMIKGGTWRIHHTMADNPPSGREVHWSQSVSWLMILFGSIRHALVSGESFQTALELGARWINPMLQAAGIIAIGALVYRLIGCAAAMLLILLLGTVGDLGWSFNALRPGHQTLHCIFGCGSLLLVLLGGLGWVARGDKIAVPANNADWVGRLEFPSEAGARRLFVASGILAGMAFWVSAAVQIFFLFSLLGTMVLLFWIAPKNDDKEISYVPGLWRMWGCTAALTSLGFYLLEYAPSGFAMRLEVNHPIYAVALYSVGELLGRLGRWKILEEKIKASDVVLMTICVIGAILPPAIIFFGPSSFHAMRDGYMMRFHNFITEFYSYPAFEKSGILKAYWKGYGFLPLAFLGGIALAGSSRIRFCEWIILWFSFSIGFFFLFVAYLQIRWLGIYAILNCWLAVIVLVVGWRFFVEEKSQFYRWAVIAGVVALISQSLFTAWINELQIRRVVAMNELMNELVSPVLAKRFAFDFNALHRNQSTIVLGDPSLSGALQYFSDARPIVSFYWENLGGLKAAAAAYSGSQDDARMVIKELGVTHVIVPENDTMANYFYYIKNNRFDRNAASETFLGRISRSWLGLPDWLKVDKDSEAIGHRRFPYGSSTINQQIQMFEVASPASSGQ